MKYPLWYGFVQGFLRVADGLVVMTTLGKVYPGNEVRFLRWFARRSVKKAAEASRA